MSLRFAVLLPLLVSLLRGCQAPPPVTRGTADQLRESFGVNLHLEYDDTPYADPQRVVAALRRVGISHARDAAMRSGSEREPRFAALARQGVRFDLFVNQDLEAQLAAVSRLTRSTPGAVDLIEGPNEANHEAFGDKPGGDAPAVQAYQRYLVEQVRRRADLAGLPVAGFTYWPPLVASADWTNFHAYPSPSRSPAAQLGWMRTMAAAVEPSRAPVVCTETGYTTTGADSVSEAREAALIPLLLLENFRAHVIRTYLYELFDEHADPNGSQREDHFGLFRFDGSPKPAALSVARLTSILTAPRALLPPPAPPRLSFSARALRTLEVKRTDGARVTFAWWSDPQHVTSRSVVVLAQRPLRTLQLDDGAEGIVAPGRTVLNIGASPLAFIQEIAARTPPPAVTGSPQGQGAYARSPPR